MFERFSKDARAAVVGAQEEARTLGHARIGTEHLLLAVVGRTGAPGATTLARLGITPEACRAAIASTAPPPGDGHFDEDDAEALRVFGIDLEAVRGRAEDTFGPGALDAPPPPEAGPRRLFRLGRKPAEGGGRPHVPFAPRAKEALKGALREAVELRSNRIGIEHVLLGVLACDDTVTSDVFRRLGADREAVRADVLADLRRAA